LYVDGAVQGKVANSTPANNTRALNVGFAWGAGTPLRFFRGIVDELEIFSRALSQAEIQAIYGAGSAGKCKPQCTSPPRIWSAGGREMGMPMTFRTVTTGRCKTARPLRPVRSGWNSVFTALTTRWTSAKIPV